MTQPCSTNSFDEAELWRRWRDWMAPGGVVTINNGGQPVTVDLERVDLDELEKLDAGLAAIVRPLVVQDLSVGGPPVLGVR